MSIAGLLTVLSSRRFKVALVSAAIGVVAYLSLNAPRLDFREHQRFVLSVDTMRGNDAEINQNVLCLRYGHLTNYDLLNNDFLKPTKSEEALRSIIPSFLSREGRQEVTHAIGAYLVILKRKSELVERFKSNNSALANSLRFFPIAATELIDEVAMTLRDPRLARDLQDIRKDILVHYIATDDLTRQKIAGRLESLLEQGKGKSGSASAAGINLVIRHARIILEYKPQIDKLLDELLTLPLPARADKISAAYNRHYQIASSAADSYQRFLYGLSVVLAVVVIGAFWRLSQLSRELSAARDTLEQRVVERTRALTDAKATLEKENTERRRAEEQLEIHMVDLQDRQRACRAAGR